MIGIAGVFLMVWAKRKSGGQRGFLGLFLLLSSIGYIPYSLAADSNSRAAPLLFSTATTPFELSSASAVKDRQVMRSRPVFIDIKLLTPVPATVARAAASEQRLSLNLFDDLVMTAEADQVTSTPRGVSWVGRLLGIEQGQAVIVVSDGVVSGNISTPAARYHIRFVENGIYEVQEIDTSLFPGDHPPAGPLRVTPGAASNTLPARARLQADDGLVIDVMVAYSATARAAAGGIAAMQSLIDLAVAETNLSYQNSGVIPRIRLVHSAEVTYDETGHVDLLNDALNCLQSTTDGCLDNIHALRDTYGADLVSLWLEDGGGYCGLGYLNSTASTGFSAVARSCATGYYSFGHELGHNMGARHDVYIDSASTPYAYAHGYTNAAALHPWRTIMAYNDACAAVGKNCARIQYWSNPGISYSGATTGDASSADNHRALNETAYSVANFRSASGSCTYSLSPASLTAGASSLVGNIAVTTSGACAWTALSNSPSWISVTSGASGSGSASVGYAVAANSASSARVGSITLAGQIFTINQAGRGSTTSTNLLQNPGFESGATSWTQSSLAGWDLISTGGIAHSGITMAWLGGYDAANDSIEQRVSIPANISSANIEFWYAISTTEPITSGALDVLTLELYSVSGTRMATLATLSNLDSTAGGWVKSPSFNLSTFKGQTVNLRFTATTDTTDSTDFFVDDVSLTASSRSTAKNITPILMLLLN
jgi:hypothetical protein